MSNTPTQFGIPNTLSPLGRRDLRGCFVFAGMGLVVLLIGPFPHLRPPPRMALPLALCALAFPVWGLSLTEWWRFSHIGVSLGLVVGGFLLPLAERISVAVPVGGSFLVGGLVSAGILHWQLRRHAGKFAIICITLTALVSAPGAEAPLVLDSRKQLFLDDYLISSMTNVRRTVEQAQKFPGNPVLSRTASWESPLAIIYGSVIRDGKEFKMWYLSRNQSGYGVSYATSEDGIRWNKPRLDLTLVDGERSNVLFNKQTIWTGAEGLPYFQELFGVQRDDREPDPARRYKMGVLDIDWKYDGPDGLPGHKGQRRGLGVAGSPDGIHWKLIESWASTAILDGGTHWMFDPARDKYVLYGRTTKELPEVKAAWSTNEGFQTWYAGRAVARLESADFVKWDFTRPLTAPVVMTADLQDPPITEIYSLKVFPYEGIYIGLVQVLHSAPEAGTLDVQLAVSRDSILFTRAGDRGTFIPLGPAGSWDRFNLSVANNDPIVAGDELRFYYSGRLYRHAPYSGPDKGVDRSSIGFATIKRDRFVALEASFDGGEIVTQPVKLKGPTLHLNAKCDFGEIVVEMLEAGGKVLGRSTPIQRDELDIPLKWSSEVEPPGGPVTLRIKLKNARLFALWCGQ